MSTPAERTAPEHSTAPERSTPESNTTPERSTPGRASPPPTVRRRRAVGWAPTQHGAWAMLVVPYALGAYLRLTDAVAGLYLVTLLGAWITGYFAFFAASGWLKSPPTRRDAWLRPLVTYLAVAASFGLVTIAAIGPAILWWLVPFLPLMVGALVLAWRRMERATLGGAFTVAAASLMLLVARYPDPNELLADPARRLPLITAGLVFAYFFGTVLYVKTNIRERGNDRFLAASVAWHAGATLVSAGLALGIGWPWWWTAFFAATTIRAAWVPRRTPALRPLQLGLVEVVFCVVLVVAFVLA